MDDVTIRPITAADDEQMGTIARTNLKAAGLDIPGTAYFDPQIMRLSAFYGAAPERRAYYVAVGKDGRVLGGAGVAEFEPLENAAELQKLYLANDAKGHGSRPPSSHILGARLRRGASRGRQRSSAA